MSNKSGSTSFNFEVFPFSDTSFSLREVGKPHIAIFNCGYQEGLRQAEVLGAVYLLMPSKERKSYGSLIQFIDFALHHPQAVKELCASTGDVQLALWSETDLNPTGTVQ